MSNNTQTRKILEKKLILGTGLAAIILAVSPNNILSVNSREPSRLNSYQTEQARPINYQEMVSDSKNTQSSSTLQQALDFKNLEITIPEPAVPQKIQDSSQQQLPSEPNYQQPSYESQIPTLKFSEKYEAEQIHKLVSKLSLPEFPLATACIGRIPNPNFFERMFCKKQVYFIADCQNAQFQPELGMNLVNTKEELDTLATVVANMYQADYIDPKAFETLAKHADLDNKFIERLEGAASPTIYDALAQFSFQYASSLTRCGNEFPGVICYTTREGHKHATSSVKSIKQLKQK